MAQFFAIMVGVLLVAAGCVVIACIIAVWTVWKVISQVAKIGKHVGTSAANKLFRAKPDDDEVPEDLQYVIESEAFWLRALEHLVAGIPNRAEGFSITYKVRLIQGSIRDRRRYLKGLTRLGKISERDPSIMG